MGEPIFRQLARTLVTTIETGAVRIGERLPTEAELAQRYGVSRHTVREAMAQLRALGLIESRQGVGSVVLSNHARVAYVETFSSIDELIRFGRAAPLRAQSVTEVVADAPLAEELRGGVGRSYLRITGLRHDNEGGLAPPAGHVQVHLDSMYAGIREDLPRLGTTIAEAVTQRYGIAIARIDQAVTSVHLPNEIAAQLGLEPGYPALSISRWYHESSGRVFEVARSHYPAGRFVYRSTLMRSQQRS